MITLEQLKKSGKIDHTEYHYLKMSFADTDDINVINNNGQTMLHRAITGNKIDLVNKLIVAGADVNISSRIKESPLHLAIKNSELVKILIQHKANVNANDAGGRTPIYYAEEPMVIDLLINSGCNLNVIDHYNHDTPLGFHGSNNLFPREDLISAILNGYASTEITKEVFQQTLIKFLKYPISAKIFKFLSKHNLYEETINEFLPEERNKLMQMTEVIDKQTNIDDPNFFLQQLFILNNPINLYSEQEALLTIQAIHSKKKSSYDFSPTFILNSRREPDQFEEYLDYIKDIEQRPLRERFVFGTDQNYSYQGIHWLSGDLLLREDEVQVILFDSLGKSSGQVKYVSDRIKLIFPDAIIYIDEIQRQNDPGGICFAFAIDDIRHSYTIHNYLNKAFKDPITGLFDYLECTDALPLSFMRTLQSKRFYNDASIIQQYTKRERTTPLGKNKPSWEELKATYENHGGFFNQYTPDEKSRNLRIREKLSAMCDLSIKYLINDIDSQEHFEELTKKFTIDRFKHNNSTKTNKY